jgi:hypothetical protein
MEREAMTIEKAFTDAARSVRTALAEVNIPSMAFTMQASGRTLDGHLRIEVTLGTEYGANVRGRNVEETLREFIRREGWNGKNNPLELSNGE